MCRWRETPDWSMPTSSTISFTACSPLRSISTMRRRVGSASISNTAVCMLMHMHNGAYKPYARLPHILVMPIRTDGILQTLAKMPAETEPIVKPSLKLTHFWLYVRNTQRSIHFYRDILGFDVLQTFPDGALLKAGSIQLGIHREERDRKSRPGGMSIILNSSDIKKDCAILLRSGVKLTFRP